MKKIAGLLLAATMAFAASRFDIVGGTLITGGHALVPIVGRSFTFDTPVVVELTVDGNKCRATGDAIGKMAAARVEIRLASDCYYVDQEGSAGFDKGHVYDKDNVYGVPGEVILPDFKDQKINDAVLPVVKFAPNQKIFVLIQGSSTNSPMD